MEEENLNNILKIRLNQTKVNRGSKVLKVKEQLNSKDPYTLPSNTILVNSRNLPI